MSNVGTAGSTTGTSVAEYHPLARPFSDALEQLGLVHVDTEIVEGESVELWDKQTPHGTTRVSIGYITGNVVVDKFDFNDRLDVKARFSSNLRSKASVTTILRSL